MQKHQWLEEEEGEKTSTHQENQKHGYDRGITITSVKFSNLKKKKKKGASDGHLHLNIVFFTGSTPVYISP